MFMFLPILNMQQTPSAKLDFRVDKKDFKNVKKPDLWQRFVPFFRKHKSDLFHWIKGHTGHPENEICDQLKASQSEEI